MLVSFFFFAFMTKVYDREVSNVLVTSIPYQSLYFMKKTGSQLDGLTIFRIYFYKNRNNTFSQLQSKNISLKFLFFSLPSHKLGSWNQSKSFYISFWYINSPKELRPRLYFCPRPKKFSKMFHFLVLGAVRSPLLSSEGPPRVNQS